MIGDGKKCDLGPKLLTFLKVLPLLDTTRPVSGEEGFYLPFFSPLTSSPRPRVRWFPGSMCRIRKGSVLRVGG